MRRLRHLLAHAQSLVHHQLHKLSSRSSCPTLAAAAIIEGNEVADKKPKQHAERAEKVLNHDAPREKEV